jgi:hypothetical protein
MRDHEKRTSNERKDTKTRIVGPSDIREPQLAWQQIHIPEDSRKDAKTQRHKDEMHSPATGCPWKNSRELNSLRLCAFA